MMTKRIITILIAVVASWCIAGAAAAQSTMRMSDQPVAVHYQDSNERVASRVLSICKNEIARVAAEIGLDTIEPIVIQVTDDIRPYRQALKGRLPTWGVAFALIQEQVIVVDVPRATRAMNSLDTVIPHELSHLLVAQRIARNPIPVWFAEGLAQWQAREWSFIDGWQLMNSIWSQDTPRLRDLLDGYPRSESRAQTAYRVSYAAFTDLFEGRTDELPLFLADVRDLGFGEAILRFSGEEMFAYMSGFQERIERKYHSRLMVFQSGPLFSIMSVLFILAGTLFLVRKRRRFKQMEDPRETWDGD